MVELSTSMDESAAVSEDTDALTEDDAGSKELDMAILELSTASGELIESMEEAGDMLDEGGMLAEAIEETTSEETDGSVLELDNIDSRLLDEVHIELDTTSSEAEEETAAEMDVGLGDSDALTEAAVDTMLTELEAIMLELDMTSKELDDMLPTLETMSAVEAYELEDALDTLSTERNRLMEELGKESELEAGSNELAAIDDDIIALDVLKAEERALSIEREAEIVLVCVVVASIETDDWTIPEDAAEALTDDACEDWLIVEDIAIMTEDDGF